MICIENDAVVCSLSCRINFVISCEFVCMCKCNFAQSPENFKRVCKMSIMRTYTDVQIRSIRQHFGRLNCLKLIYFEINFRQFGKPQSNSTKRRFFVNRINISSTKTTVTDAVVHWDKRTHRRMNQRTTMTTTRQQHHSMYVLFGSVSLTDN